MRIILFTTAVFVLFSLTSCEKNDHLKGVSTDSTESISSPEETLRAKLLGTWTMVSKYDESTGATTYYKDWYLQFCNNGDYILSIYHPDNNQWEYFNYTFSILTATTYKGNLTNEIVVTKIDENNLETTQIVSGVKYINTYTR